MVGKWSVERSPALTDKIAIAGQTKGWDQSTEADGRFPIRSTAQFYRYVPDNIYVYPKQSTRLYQALLSENR